MGRGLNLSSRIGVAAMVVAAMVVAVMAAVVAAGVLAAPPAGAQTMPPQPAPATPSPPPQPPPSNQFSPNELVDAGHRLFGGVSRGLAGVVEKAVSQWGQPNGYILSEEAGGAFVG